MGMEEAAFENFTGGLAKQYGFSYVTPVPWRGRREGVRFIFSLAPHPAITDPPSDFFYSWGGWEKHPTAHE